MKRRNMPTQRGFSMVELAVSLAIMGAMGVAVWRLLPFSRDIAEGQPVQVQLAQAQTAIDGFLLARHRLPCADTDDDGRENCGATAAGKLPWRDLGLGRSFAVLRYDAYRTGVNNLTQALARQTPLLPPGAASVGAVINGLDLCVALRGAAASPALGSLNAGGVPSAYALAHPGADGVFQGLNTTGFEMPGRAVSQDYDDAVAATGLAELSGRLACPTRLGEANAAARAAYAAYDLDRDMEKFLWFRSFAHDVSVTNLNFANSAQTTAILDTVIASANAVTAVAIAGNSVGVGLGVVAAAALPVVLSAAALTAAILGQQAAATAEAKNSAQYTGALLLRAQSAQALVEATNAAIRVDSKGLNP